MSVSERASVSIAEAGEMTTLSPQTLRKLISTGELRAARVGRRVLIPIREIERITRGGAKSETSTGKQSKRK